MSSRNTSARLTPRNSIKAGNRRFAVAMLFLPGDAATWAYATILGRDGTEIGAANLGYFAEERAGDLIADETEPVFSLCRQLFESLGFGPAADAEIEEIDDALADVEWQLRGMAKRAYAKR